MVWYLIGAVLCVAIVWWLQKRTGEKKNRQKAALIAAAGFTLAFLLAVKEEKNTDSDYMERSAPGEGSRQQEYILEAGDVLQEYCWNVTAEERRLTAEEREELLETAERELEQTILGENESLDKINKNLNLPDTLQNGVIEVEYAFSDYEIFYPDGTIRSLPEESTIVILSAEMKCQGEASIYEFAIQAVPAKKGSKEQLIDKIEMLLAQENQKAGTDKLKLPEEVEGVKLAWKERKENRSFPIMILGIVAAGCMIASEKEKEKREQKERERQLQRDYPEIIGKLVLLMGAGMTPAMAWKRIAETYRKCRQEKKMPKKPAYEEMLTAVHEMQEGIGEIQAYHNFGDRCAISEYRRLSAILVQNVRKGNAQIQRILEEEKQEAYEKQRARVRTAGEEAGTKLLMPMLLMLLVVLVIIMVPAGMSMQM